jgi:hypothetical protein
MNERIIRPNDVTAMVDSMIELFQEKDKVSPKMLAERMTHKCGRNIHYHYASFLFTQFGFVTKVFEGRVCRAERYIIPNDELLKRLKTEAPNIEARSKVYAEFTPTHIPRRIVDVW